MTKRSLTVDVEQVWEIPAAAEIHMLVPIGDRDRMLTLAEKITELGATSWRPVVWRRSKSVEGRGEGPTFVGKIRARMISALTQSGGGWLPEIHPSAPIARALAASPAANRILLDANAEHGMLSVSNTFPMVIALGPEGGLADDERQQMIDHLELGVVLPAEAFAALQKGNTNRADANAFWQIQARNLAKMNSLNAHIVVGTDGNTPFAPHFEMEDMVAAGMTPAQVIRAATSNGAQFLG